MRQLLRELCEAVLEQVGKVQTDRLRRALRRDEPERVRRTTGSDRGCVKTPGDRKAPS